MNNLISDVIKIELNGSISLLNYLIKKIKEFKKDKISYFELNKFTNDEDYQTIQDILYKLDGSSHQLSILDGIFETNNKEFEKNDYGLSKLIPKKDNKMSSKILIKEIKETIECMNKDFEKERIKDYEDYK